jgi:hypothetical protein
LIAASLGGWGKRANLVPQDTLGYPNSSTLIPSTFSLYLEDRVQGDSIWRTFQNVDLGGTSRTSNRQAMVSFLIANGCS